jgi:hypothetical protein
MTIKNDFGLDGVSGNLQYGKTGGRLIYNPETSSFKITLADQTLLADIKASDITSEDGNIVITSPTGKFIIDTTNLSLLQEGVFNFEGTKALTIPVGNNQARPETPVIGMVRVNDTTTSPFLEYYNGAIWVSTNPTQTLEGEIISHTTTFEYDSIGQVTKMTENIGTMQRITNYSYTQDGLVASIVTTYLGQTRTETYSYNSDSSIEQIQTQVTQG